MALILRLIRFLFPLFWLLLTGAGAPPQLLVAMASDLNQVGPALVQDFEQEQSCHVKLVLGSSGNLTSQILADAPFDVFLSADQNYPRFLQESGKVVGGTRARYAIGQLVLWVRRDSPVAGARSLTALDHPGLRKLAIANPAHAPYGRAAVAALKKMGRWERLQEHVVYGENIAQAAQFATTGAVDAALISLSQARVVPLKDMGSYEIVPPRFYSPIVQELAVIKGTHKLRLAVAFSSFVRSPRGQKILQRFGFQVPGG